VVEQEGGVKIGALVDAWKDAMDQCEAKGVVALKTWNEVGDITWSLYPMDVLMSIEDKAKFKAGIFWKS